jgi:hypothetical protein
VFGLNDGATCPRSGCRWVEISGTLEFSVSAAVDARRKTHQTCTKQSLADGDHDFFELVVAQIKVLKHVDLGLGSFVTYSDATGANNIKHRNAARPKNVSKASCTCSADRPRFVAVLGRSPTT